MIKVGFVGQASAGNASHRARFVKQKCGGIEGVLLLFQDLATFAVPIHHPPHFAGDILQGQDPANGRVLLALRAFDVGGMFDVERTLLGERGHHGIRIAVVPAAAIIASKDPSRDQR
ncbi:hypothetical protein D3C79_954340 [compost metagenome]